jgi:hypothetical protein
MPDGKPAGVRCVQLTPDDRCALFGQPDRPSVCRTLQPSTEMCGTDREAALLWLSALEAATAPAAPIALPVARRADRPTGRPVGSRRNGDVKTS